MSLTLHSSATLSWHVNSTREAVIEAILTSFAAVATTRVELYRYCSTNLPPPYIVKPRSTKPRMRWDDMLHREACRKGSLWLWSIDTALRGPLSYRTARVNGGGERQANPLQWTDSTLAKDAEGDFLFELNNVQACSMPLHVPEITERQLHHLNSTSNAFARFGVASSQSSSAQFVPMDGCLNISNVLSCGDGVWRVAARAEVKTWSSTKNLRSVIEHAAKTT